MQEILSFVGMSCSIAGAALMAWGGKLAVLGWPVWIIASICWGVSALQISSAPLLLQQVFFFAINCFGLYRWTVLKRTPQ